MSTISPPKKGHEFRNFVLIAVGVSATFIVPAVLQDWHRAHAPVPDTTVRVADLREVLPTLLPVGGTPVGTPEIDDVRCKPLTPAEAAVKTRVPGTEEQVELALRRQMAELRWRDLPDRSHVGPTAVTMRYEPGIGEEKRGTVTYVLRGDDHATTVRVSLVGSIRGRCGVR